MRWLMVLVSPAVLAPIYFSAPPRQVLFLLLLLLLQPLRPEGYVEQETKARASGNWVTIGLVGMPELLPAVGCVPVRSPRGIAFLCDALPRVQALPVRQDREPAGDSRAAESS